jgi:hypothetical protein
MYAIRVQRTTVVTHFRSLHARGSTALSNATNVCGRRMTSFRRALAGSVFIFTFHVTDLLPEVLFTNEVELPCQ